MIVFQRLVIPAPYQVRGKLQQESRVPGENRDPVFEMVPDFRRDDVWIPVFTGMTDKDRAFFKALKCYD
jgi:hypothetical protein